MAKNWNRAYILAVIIIVIAIFYNYLHNINIKHENEINDIHNFYKERIASLEKSNTIAFRRISYSNGINITNNEEKTILFNKKYLIVLLSDFSCSKCQENELKRLNSLLATMDSKGIDIIGITTQAKKTQVAIQRKLLKIKFPIYWVEDKKFNSISIAKKYPQIIYVKDNIIQSAFLPVPLDDEFSEMFYDHLLKNF